MDDRAWNCHLGLRRFAPASFLVAQPKICDREFNVFADRFDGHAVVPNEQAAAEFILVDRRKLGDCSGLNYAQSPDHDSS